MELDNLKYAVVKQACKDYRAGLKGLMRSPSNPCYIRAVNDCESFFRNEIEIYTELDGETLMRRIREDVERQWENKKRI